MSQQAKQSNTDQNLPQSITILEKYGFTKRVETTAENMPSDFYLEFREMPSDLLVPALVFFSIRDVDGAILSISHSVTRNPAINGLVDSSDPNVTRSIEDIETLPRVASVNDTEEQLSSYEIVIEQSRSKPMVDSSEARTIDSTELEILNLHDHSYRDGVSLYLRDPADSIDIEDDDYKTMADLLD